MRLWLRLWQRWRQWLTDWLTAQQVKRKSKKGANFRQWLAGEQSVVANRNGSFGFWLVLVWQAVVSNKFLKNRAWQGGERSLALCRAQKSLNLQWTTKVLGLWCLSRCCLVGLANLTARTYSTCTHTSHVHLYVDLFYGILHTGLQRQKEYRHKDDDDNSDDGGDGDDVDDDWEQCQVQCKEPQRVQAWEQTRLSWVKPSRSFLPCGRFISSYTKVPNDFPYTLYTHGKVYSLHYFLAITPF